VINGRWKSRGHPPAQRFLLCPGRSLRRGGGLCLPLCRVPGVLDGNKRTGIAAALVFLKLNAVTVPCATGELYTAMIAIAQRRMGQAGAGRSVAAAGWTA